MRIFIEKLYTEGQGFVSFQAHDAIEIDLTLRMLFPWDGGPTLKYFGQRLTAAQNIRLFDSEHKLFETFFAEFPQVSAYAETLPQAYSVFFSAFFTVREFIESVCIPAVLHASEALLATPILQFVRSEDRVAKYSGVPFPLAKRAIGVANCGRAHYDAARALLACYSICPDCGEKMRLDTYCHACKTACDDCGEVIDVDDAITVGEKVLCEDCAAEYVACEECGEFIRIADANEYGDSFYCDDCFEDKFFTCEKCNEVFPINQEVCADNNSYCETCFDNSYVHCEDCGEPVHVDYAFFDSNTGRSYCPACYEERMPQGVNIHEYSYKPSAVFHDCGETSKLFFGVELEYNADGSDKIESIEQARGLDDNDIYVKTDGSISGYELVSHPRTLASWRKYIVETYSDVLSKIESAGGYADNSTGIHIHISKGAMCDAHKAKLAMFVNNFTGLSTFVARRNATQYQRYCEKSEQEYVNVQRYEAVNWFNDTTVELRIFKSTFDANILLSYLQYAHAAYQYTKQDIRACDMTVKGFMSFVNSRHETYSHLSGRLTDYKGAI